MSSYFVYILECVNGAYYTGYTTDMERRYREHCEGKKKCKYTRSFAPKKIAVCWEVESLSVALRLEMAIKKLKIELKMNLIGEAKTHNKTHNKNLANNLNNNDAG
jgi:putative endonuclease